ncbi:MAG: hypothetical protein PHE43_01375 [Candidatus Nanoarchaeia archaeon]|nr:hypothetical protein [Candidatus Nanoarchaeia archaeon]
MRQVHNINESYRDYHFRKYGLPNALIMTGIFAFCFGMFIFNLFRVNDSVKEGLLFGGGLIVTGIILFIIGIKIRTSRKNKCFSP